MKKNISILIYSLSSGGAERVVSILLDKLKEKYNITLVLMNNTIFYDIPKDVEVVYIEKSNPNESGIKKFLKLPILGLKYKKLLEDKKIDVSLSFMVRPNYINAFAKFFGSRAKTIICERSMFSFQFGYKNIQSFLNRLLVKLYNFADLIVANSKGNKEDLKKNFKIKTEVKTIYNVLNIEQIRRKKEENVDIEKKDFTFITIGRIDEGKNHKLIINAIKNIDAKLWIIGDGHLKKELEGMIKNLKLQNKVKLLGKQSNPYKFLSKADAFVFSSNHEGFPNVLLEALACELPIISTDCRSGPREILAPNSDFTKQATDIEIAEFGVLVPVGDVKKMADAMKMIIEDENLRNRLRKKALNRAKDFEIDKIIKEWEEIIEKVYKETKCK